MPSWPQASADQIESTPSRSAAWAKRTAESQSLTPVAVETDRDFERSAGHAGYPSVCLMALICPTWSRSWTRWKRYHARPCRSPKNGCAEVGSNCGGSGSPSITWRTRERSREAQERAPRRADRQPVGPGRSRRCPAARLRDRGRSRAQSPTWRSCVSHQGRAVRPPRCSSPRALASQAACSALTPRKVSSNSTRAVTTRGHSSTQRYFCPCPLR